VPFATLRGQLPAPVDASVVQRFGREVDAEFHTQVFHKGIDFGATLGDPVRAVAAGTVRFAGWFRGYGRMVILDHGDRFYTVSGHLDALRVAMGNFVAAGEPIGTVGDTGSLRGPRLYFEIREGSEAVDPLAWLAPGAARANGSPTLATIPPIPAAVVRRPSRQHPDPRWILPLGSQRVGRGAVRSSRTSSADDVSQLRVGASRPPADCSGRTPAPATCFSLWYFCC